MKVNVSKLKHHPLNTEIYLLSSVQDLIISIEEVGLLQPLVVNKKYEVLSGNRRLEAIRSLSWKKVNVELINPEQDEESNLIVHYNKQRVKSCRELLNEVFILLPGFEVGRGKRTDLTSVPQNTSGKARDKIADTIGISSSQIGKLLFIQKTDPHYIKLIDDGHLTVSQAYLTVQRQKNQQDSLNENPDSAIENTKDFRFYNKSSHHMSEIKNNTASLIFTSPPYWNKRNYVKDGGLGNEKSDKDYVTNLVCHLKDCKRILKNDGSFWGWGINGTRFVVGAAPQTTCFSSPVQEFSQSYGWCKADACYHNMALKVDGTLWGWTNFQLRGELGDAMSGGGCSPTQEYHSLTTWCDISVRAWATFAIKG